MSDQPEVIADLRAPTRRFLPLLLLLFVGSGCAALIYEIVWFQLLQLVIGSNAVSLGVLLGTFMGGMGLGSLALPRLISADHHPLRVYGLLELGLGLLGISVLFLIPWVGRFYVSNVGHGLPALLLRGVICAACLLPPTVLMGATLPAISRWIEATPQGVSWLGFFYSGNIAGAVFGCLLAGFYLLRVHDMAFATYAAAIINGAVALTGLALAAKTPNRPPATAPTAAATNASGPKSVPSVPKVDSEPPASGSAAIYLTIALSGLCALGAEVIWTRQLSLLLGGTVYTFSIILAVFLVGLGLGSSGGAVAARLFPRPRSALALCQLLLAGAIAWTALMLANSLPYWPVNPSLSRSPWFNFQIDLARCAWAILPATILWGASFPLALAAAAHRGHDPGKLVGGVYAANTVGAIFGAVAFSIWLVPWLGTQQAHRILIATSGAAALGLLFPRLRATSVTNHSEGPLQGTHPIIWMIAMGLGVFLVWTVPKVPRELIAYGRFLTTWVGQGDILYAGEGMNSSVAVSQLWDSGVLNFHVSGKIEASSEPQDMRLQRMLGHIPALVHPKPRSVLIVGCGAGVTAGSFVLHPDIERIVICEIEPLIPKVVAQYFGAENYHLLKDPRVEVIYDDARHYVLTTQEKFDIITSDPIHPWVKGAATLYTREYFEICQRRLNPGGVITQWVPLYESNPEVVKSELATFFDVFPSGTIWSNDENGRGYDIVLLGQAKDASINIDQLQDRLDRPDHRRVFASLDNVGFKSAIDLLATYAGRGVNLRPWLKNAEINRDRNLRLQYLAGLGLNANQGGSIYTEMLTYREFPEDMFIASPERMDQLKRALK